MPSAKLFPDPKSCSDPVPNASDSHVSVNRHTSTTAVCYRVTLPLEVRKRHITFVDRYASRALMLHPSAVQLSDGRAALQVQHVRSAAALFAFALQTALLLLLLPLRYRLRERVSFDRCRRQPRSDGWLRWLAIRVSHPPVTLHLHVSHARRQRHNQTCQMLLATAPRFLGLATNSDLPQPPVPACR